MELRQLEYFQTLAHLRNFTRTAERLHVSQPSVTKAIKALESEFCLPLFDRRQKQVHLTAAGKAFLLHADEILSAVAAAEEEMHRLKPSREGKIRFGLPPMVEAYLFPRLFASFRDAYPRVDLLVMESHDSTEVKRKVEDGSLDFGVLLGAPEEAGMSALPILEDNLNLCLSFSHALAGQKTVPMRLFRKEQFILQQPGTYQYDSVIRACAASGFFPDILLCTSQIKTIKQLVSGGVGISVLPGFATRGETSFAKVALEPPIPLRVSLFWREDAHPMGLKAKFIEFVGSYAKAQGLTN